MRVFAAVACVFALVVLLAPTADAAPVPEPPTVVKRALQSAWGTGREYRIARCVAWHESRYTLRLVSRTGDHGLMQINYVAHRNWVAFDSRIYTAAYNVAVARRIYEDAWRRYGWSGRWRPWVAYRYCVGVR